MSFGGASFGGASFGSGGAGSPLGAVVYYIKHQWTVFISQVNRKVLYVVEQDSPIGYIVNQVRKVLHL